MLNRSRHTLSSWIAILAVLLNALMPTVSVTLDNLWNKNSNIDASINASAGGWIEVCSTNGSIWVRLAADGRLLEQTDRKPANAPNSMGHCAYCVTHAASFGLPPIPIWVVPVLSLAAGLVPRNQPTPRLPAPWLVPAARAPPTSTCL